MWARRISLRASVFVVDEELYKTNGEWSSLIAIMRVLDVEWRAGDG